jgi:hypothetical protein
MCWRVLEGLSSVIRDQDYHQLVVDFLDALRGTNGVKGENLPSDRKFLSSLSEATLNYYEQFIHEVRLAFPDDKRLQRISESIASLVENSQTETQNVEKGRTYVLQALKEKLSSRSYSEIQPDSMEDDELYRYVISNHYSLTVLRHIPLSEVSQEVLKQIIVQKFDSETAKVAFQFLDEATWDEILDEVVFPDPANLRLIPLSTIPYANLRRVAQFAIDKKLEDRSRFVEQVLPRLSADDIASIYTDLRQESGSSRSRYLIRSIIPFAPKSVIQDILENHRISELREIIGFAVGISRYTSAPKAEEILTKSLSSFLNDPPMQQLRDLLPYYEQIPEAQQQHLQSLGWKLIENDVSTVDEFNAERWMGHLPPQDQLRLLQLILERHTRRMCNFLEVVDSRVANQFIRYAVNEVVSGKIEPFRLFSRSCVNSLSEDLALKLAQFIEHRTRTENEKKRLPSSRHLLPEIERILHLLPISYVTRLVQETLDDRLSLPYGCLPLISPQQLARAYDEGQQRGVSPSHYLQSICLVLAAKTANDDRQYWLEKTRSLAEVPYDDYRHLANFPEFHGFLLDEIENIRDANFVAQVLRRIVALSGDSKVLNRAFEIAIDLPLEYISEDKRVRYPISVSLSAFTERDVIGKLPKELIEQIITIPSPIRRRSVPHQVDEWPQSASIDARCEKLMRHRADGEAVLLSR